MYKLVKQKRKTISIGIDENLQIIVKAPNQVSQKYIDEFVKRHDEWIQKKKQSQACAKAHQNWWQTRKILYFGQYNDIQIVSSAQEQVFHIENKIIISLNNIKDQKRAQVLLERWLNQQIKELMTEISDKYCKKLGCHYNKIYIRKQRTRWGSCSEKGNLSYNSRLICAPRGCIEYIGLHEVMHLKHFNHSKDFWEAITLIMPEYKNYQNILKQQSMYYDF